MRLDYSFHAPDFVITTPVPFVLEATVAAPAKGQPAAFGLGAPQIPDDLNEFNREAILRICNSFDAKIRRYREHYATLTHVHDKPFVIAIAPFDRPVAHLAANRAIVAALYGVYFDETATLAAESDEVLVYDIDAVAKHSTASVAVGLFGNEAYREVSAVIYGPLASWGKVRALADAPTRPSVFTTIHPSSDGLLPSVRTTGKADYVEHLLDGLYVLHNPFASRPLPAQVFDHERIAHFVAHTNGTVELQAPDDFLLMRMVETLGRTYRA